jgi:hypothetical protein
MSMGCSGKVMCRSEMLSYEDSGRWDYEVLVNGG